jgi:hypothetical protein
VGRPHTTRPQVPPEFIQQCFIVGDNSGKLLWRERPPEHFLQRRQDHRHFSAAFAGKPAGMLGPGGKPLVRFVYEGHTRRVALLKVAWIVATGELPCGVVRPRDGDEWNATAANLIVTKAGAGTFDQGKGGKRSSLAERQFRSTLLLKALAANPGSTVPVLSELIGSSVSCCCTRLGKLADMGLTCGPKCDARARWDLSPAGQALAAAASPVVIDGLDTDLLEMIASGPMRQLELARRCGIASLTVKRRVWRLIEAGMVTTDSERRFCISRVGIAALGGEAPPKPVSPWLRVEAISAASSRDVIERVEHRPNDDRTAAMKSEQGRTTRLKVLSTARLNSAERFNSAPAELSLNRRMAG